MLTFEQKKELEKARNLLDLANNLASDEQAQYALKMKRKIIEDQFDPDIYDDKSNEKEKKLAELENAYRSYRELTELDKLQSCKTISFSLKPNISIKTLEDQIDNFVKKLPKDQQENIEQTFDKVNNRLIIRITGNNAEALADKLMGFLKNSALIDQSTFKEELTTTTQMNENKADFTSEDKSRFNPTPLRTIPSPHELD